MDLALNNLQRSICHKTQQTKPKQRNILPSDPNEKVKLILYYNKFKASRLVIDNNSSPSIGVLQKKKKKKKLLINLNVLLEIVYLKNLYIRGYQKNRFGILKG